MKPSSGTCALAVGTLLIFSGVGVSMVELQRYKSAPGPAAPSPLHWPEDSTIRRTNRNLPALILFAHPMCPCTRASITELRELMSTAGQSNVEAFVLLAMPEGVEDDWRDSDIEKSASSIPSVRVVIDEGRRESRRFGALTSGHVVLYDRDGDLRFSGGITNARGHLGDNPGVRRIASILNGRIADRDQGPVFGCSIEED